MSKSLVNKLFVGGALLLVALLVLVLYAHFSSIIPFSLNTLFRAKPQASYQIEHVENPLKVSFSSDIPGVTVLDPVSVQTLQAILDTAGYRTGQNLGVVGTEKGVAPKELHVVYRDIRTIQLGAQVPQELFATETDNTGQVAVGFSQEYNAKTKVLTSYVYLVPWFQEAGVETEAEIWTWHFARLIFVLSQSELRSNDWVDYWQRLGDVLDQQENLLQLESAPDVVSVVVQRIPVLAALFAGYLPVPPPVIAQQCQGVRECGQWTSVGLCPSGQTCGTNGFCLPSGIACSFDMHCQGGVLTPGQACGDGCSGSCPFPLCSDGQYNSCTTGGSCPAGKIFCGGGCGCMDNTQTCSYWMANNCGYPPGGGPGGSGTGNCAGLDLNCGQICQAPQEPLGAGVCTPDMQTCGYIPGQSYNVCWHDCCSLGGGGGNPGPASGARIVGTVQFMPGTQESIDYPGRLLYWPPANVNAWFALSLTSSRSGFGRWEGSNNTDYYYWVRPGDSTNGEFQVGEEINVTLRLPTEDDPYHLAGQNPPHGLEDYDCEWSFTGNPGGAYGSNVDCGGGQETMSGEGCTATVNLCSSNNPAWVDWQNQLTFQIKPKMTKSCQVTMERLADPLNPASGIAVTSITNEDIADNRLVLKTAADSTKSSESIKIFATTKAAGSTLPTSNQLPLPLPIGQKLLPTLGTATAAVHSPSGGLHFYEFNTAGCEVGGGTDFCTTRTRITNLPPGDYYFMCNLESENPYRCTGNPHCIDKGLGGALDCSALGWNSCHAQNLDTTPLTVQCVATCDPDVGCGTLAGTPGQVNGSSVVMSVSGTTQIWEDGGINYVKYQTSSATQITLNWNPPTVPDGTTINRYDILLTPRGILPSNCGANCLTLTSTSATRSFTPAVTQTNRFDIYVRAVNSTPCAQTYSGNWSAVRRVNLVGDIAGNVYLTNGNHGVGGGMCTGGGTAAVTGPDASTEITGSAPGNTINTSFTFDGSTTAYTLENMPFLPSVTWGGSVTATAQFTSDDASNRIVCACPGDDCEYSGLISPRTGVNFYAQKYDLTNGPWWQTWGGMLYAASGQVLSDIPETCIADATGYCRPFITAQNTAESEYSGGVVLLGTGGTASSGDTEGYVTDRTPLVADQQIASGTDHDGVQHEDYDHFVREILVSAYSSDPVSSSVSNGDDIFDTHSTVKDDGTHIYYSPVSVTIDPSELISSNDIPGATKKAVVLINGNLTIRDSADLGQLIEVENGHFLSFIVSGSITIEGSVGYDKTLLNTISVETTDPNIAGVYVAGTNLIVDGYSSIPTLSDRKLIAAGTFVGLSDISINRDFQNSNDPITRAMNNLDPVVTFVYRPDFVKNIPEFMRTPGMVWQEVN